MKTKAKPLFYSQRKHRFFGLTEVRCWDPGGAHQGRQNCRFCILSPLLRAKDHSHPAFWRPIRPPGPGRGISPPFLHPGRGEASFP